MPQRTLAEELDRGVLVGVELTDARNEQNVLRVPTERPDDGAGALDNDAYVQVMLLKHSPRQCLMTWCSFHYLWHRLCLILSTGPGGKKCAESAEHIQSDSTQTATIDKLRAGQQGHQVEMGTGNSCVCDHPCDSDCGGKLGHNLDTPSAAPVQERGDGSAAACSAPAGVRVMHAAHLRPKPRLGAGSAPASTVCVTGNHTVMRHWYASLARVTGMRHWRHASLACVTGNDTVMRSDTL